MCNSTALLLTRFLCDYSCRSGIVVAKDFRYISSWLQSLSFMLVEQTMCCMCRTKPHDITLILFTWVLPNVFVMLRLSYQKLSQLLWFWLNPWAPLVTTQKVFYSETVEHIVRLWECDVVGKALSPLLSRSRVPGWHDNQRRWLVRKSELFCNSAATLDVVGTIDVVRFSASHAGITRLLGTGERLTGIYPQGPSSHHHPRDIIEIVSSLDCTNIFTTVELRKCICFSSYCRLFCFNRKLLDTLLCGTILEELVKHFKCRWRG